MPVVSFYFVIRHTLKAGPWKYCPTLPVPGAKKVGDRCFNRPMIIRDRGTQRPIVPVDPCMCKENIKMKQENPISDKDKQQSRRTRQPTLGILSMVD